MDNYYKKLQTLQKEFKEISEKTSSEGVFSKSMGVDTKPSHKLTLNGYWILVDGKMPQKEFLELENNINKLNKA